MEKINPDKLVLFDGYCNLCSFSVEFILKREKNEELFFCSLQSEASQKFLAPHVYELRSRDSVLFLENGVLYAEDKAALRISGYLKFPWRQLGFAARIVPHFLALSIYRLIAKNRFKIFGKKTACYVPEKNVSHRFLN